MKKETFRKKLPTLILRIIAVLSAVAGVLFCVFLVPSFGGDAMKEIPAYLSWRYPIIAGLYVLAGCFFFALYQLWRLLGGIDRNGTLAYKPLRAIRISAVLFSVLYILVVLPVFYLAAQLDDAPGLILFGAFFDVFPVGIAAAAAVLERFAKKE